MGPGSRTFKKYTSYPSAIYIQFLSGKNFCFVVREIVQQERHLPCTWPAQIFSPAPIWFPGMASKGKRIFFHLGPTPVCSQFTPDSVFRGCSQWFSRDLKVLGTNVDLLHDNKCLAYWTMSLVLNDSKYFESHLLLSFLSIPWFPTGPSLKAYKNNLL